MSKSDDDEIKIYRRANRLKQRMSATNPRAAGKIGDEAIEKAQAAVDRMCEAYPGKIEAALKLLEKEWNGMRDLPQSDERAEKAEKVFTLAHNVKDISAQCGYELMAYFAENLRDYVTRTNFSMEAQRVITQACVDAMKVVFKKDIKKDGGPVADELKDVLQKAITKYS